MDTSVDDIEFDMSGECSYCKDFDQEIYKYWKPNDEGKKFLENKILEIREKYDKRKYHAIIGLSGGKDSSYLALKLKEYNLRILAVHVDAGWNSEIAVSNIEKIVDYCNLDLYTYVVDWDNIRRLQLAYLRSGIANQDVPQDHVFFSVLYRTALKENINIFFSGGNMATEYIFPRNWHGDAMDKINLLNIFKKYGDGKLNKYPTVSFYEWQIKYLIKNIEQIRPLDYLPYSTLKAQEELIKMGWKPYGAKHGESVFTKFFQNYYLPKRFGYDKRIPHLSSRILSGDLSRDEALEILNTPPYSEAEIEHDLAYVADKLEITINELKSFIEETEKKTYKDFKNWDNRILILKKIFNLLILNSFIKKILKMLLRKKSLFNET